MTPKEGGDLLERKLLCNRVQQPLPESFSHSDVKLAFRTSGRRGSPDGVVGNRLCLADLCLQTAWFTNCLVYELLRLQFTLTTKLRAMRRAMGMMVSK
jgi:hypothetical protein